jgi:toxin YhaV
MEVNGWRLFQHPLFKYQYDKLLAEAEHIQERQPDKYKNHKTVKLLARVTQLISEEIPANPAHDRFNQGNTLGAQYRHWKRAKFGRYRLFFRYEAKTKEKGKGRAIVFTWINDEDTLCKEGDKNDPYAIFAKGRERGKPPDSFDALLKQSKELDIAEEEPNKNSL